MSLYLSGVAFVFVSNAFYVGLGDMAKISYPDILMAKSQSQFYHDSLVFHTGSEYFTSHGTIRATVLLTNIWSAYIWFLVPQNDFILIYELLNCKNYMQSKCVLLTNCRLCKSKQIERFF